MVVGGDALTAHYPETGKEIWRAGGWDPQKTTSGRIVASPVTYADLAYVCPPKGGAMFAVRDGGAGDVTASHIAWKSRELTSDVCVPLVYKDHLYVLDGDKKKLSCVEPRTGKILWQGSLGGKVVFRASPTGADNKIYCMNENGDLWVLSADEFKVLSTFPTKLGRSRGSIVLIDGQVIVRAGDTLCAFGKKAGEI